MRWWKVMGLAGLVGVAATGAVVARSQRRRRTYTPEEIRARLHARLAEAEPAGAEPVEAEPAGTELAAVRPPGPPRRRWRRGSR